MFTLDAPPDEDYVCPPGVLRELKSFDDPRLELWGDMLRISDCTKESMNRVDEVAKRTGDAGRLSPMDRSVLALALDVNGTILSDDYSIQNVARVLGLEFRPVGTTGIKKVAKWNYRCNGCGKWYKEKYPECPICGSTMKACRKRRSGEQTLATDEIAHPALPENRHAHAGGRLGSERERVGQLLVECRRLQRFLHHMPPLGLVIR